MINTYINLGTGYRTALVAAAALVIGGCATAKPEKAEMAEAAPAVSTEVMMKEVILESAETFEWNSADLTSVGKASLDAMIAEGEAEGAIGGEVVVTGYADPTGDANYNLKLSQRRADAVRDYLVANGVPADAITATGRGETTRFAECDQSNFQALVACYAPNRVVIVTYGIVQSEEVEVTN